MSLTQLDARRVVQTVGSAGQPPVWGAGLFTDGFDKTLKVLDDEFLRDYLLHGGSVFKLVVGHYGGGKTHFLYLLRELAWKQDYVVAYVSLTPEETPFHRLDLVYRAIAGAVAYAPPDRIPNPGLLALLKTVVARWREQVPDGSPEVLETMARDATRELDSLNYQRAMTSALKALIAGDEETALDLVQWLGAEGYDRNVHRQHGILSGIDRSTALTSIRCLARFVRQAGYAGLVVLFDEAERLPSLSGRQKEFMLSNLRELIDESARGTVPGLFMAYAIPDFRFFDGKTGVYEAVKQRTSTMFDFYNPSGVSIRLEQMNTELLPHLRAIGTKLWKIYEIAYGCELPEDEAAKAVDVIARATESERFGDVSYRRVFVQSAVRGFEELRRKPDVAVSQEWAAGIVDQFLGGDGS